MGLGLASIDVRWAVSEAAVLVCELVLWTWLRAAAAIRSVAERGEVGDVYKVM